MKNFFSISQTAKIVQSTAETLRHYDRVGLLKPSKTDEWTGYRYYSEQDIVCLNTIRALRCMDMSLVEIKEILQFSDFENIASFLKQLEHRADVKIAELNHAKTKMTTARLYYESKLSSKEQKGILLKTYPKRVILLSEKLCEPSLDNLWDYHRHFYAQVGSALKDAFSFEDLAGIYTEQERTHLFAVCTRYENVKNIKELPQGQYLCADCTESACDEMLKQLLSEAKRRYHVVPECTIQIIVLSGILKWNYQLQVFVGCND